MDEGRHVGYEIKALDQLIRRAIVNISLKNGMDQVTVMHGWIIGYLYRNREKDIYQKDLEAEFQITRSTVTSILKLMEKKGYIERVSVEKDARLKKLILTEKAIAIQRKNCMDINQILEKQLIRDISPEEMEIFCRVLHRMRHNLEEEKGATA